MAFSLAVLPGDGIGPEVVESALRILDAVSERGQLALEVERGLIGGAAIDQEGSPFPQATRDMVHRADAVLLGAVGGPAWANLPVTPEAGLLALRESLGLFANIRPFEVLPGLENVSPLRNPPRSGVIIRELLGGLYYGKPRERVRRGDGAWEAIDTARYAVPEIERVARIGFQLAARTGVPLVSVDKANVLETSRLWRETVTRVGGEFPEVPLVHRYVDAAAMEMVLHPERYQVVVTENLFGDILSDLTGGLVGSLGLLGSATVRQWGPGPGLFEPIHGSAPDIQGQGISNPVGAIWSLALLLEWSCGLTEAAAWVRSAVRRAIQDGIRTPDLGGSDGTEAMTQRVLDHLEAEAN